MTEGQARDAVNGAALVVAGLYFYRKLIEPAVRGDRNGATVPRPPAGSPVRKLASYAENEPDSLRGAAAQLAGFGEVAPLGRFIVGFGFSWLVLSLVEAGSPKLAGYMALLIATGSVIGNGYQVSADVSWQLQNTGKARPASSFDNLDTAPTVQIARWEGGSPTNNGPARQQGSARTRSKSRPS